MIQSLQLPYKNVRGRRKTRFEPDQSISQYTQDTAEDFQSTVSKKIRLRLIVALPILTFIFMIFSGMVLSYAFSRFFSHSEALDGMVEGVTSMWTLVMAALALISCFVAARMITRRMNRITLGLEQLFPAGTGSAF